ncbi:MAG: hypothetical protein IT385_29475 [Deltaproteobacteria bacterium]|nr:hypothetical protein [Deltaproteobacteria bacterium]
MSASPEQPAPDAPSPRPTVDDVDEGALKELASEVVAPVAPVGSAVRADVDRFTSFLRSIHSGYLLAGLALFVLTGAFDLVVVVSRGFSDWYMHLAMLVILGAFVLLYVRAHQLGRRIARGIYAVLAIALLVFYAWILADLVPPRLDVLSDRLRPDGLRGPEVVLRPEAGLLYIVVAGLGVVGAWLALHWLVIGRVQERRPLAAPAHGAP